MSSSIPQTPSLAGAGSNHGRYNSCSQSDRLQSQRSSSGDSGTAAGPAGPGAAVLTPDGAGSDHIRPVHIQLRNQAPSLAPRTARKRAGTRGPASPPATDFPLTGAGSTIRRTHVLSQDDQVRSLASRTTRKRGTRGLASPPATDIPPNGAGSAKYRARVMSQVYDQARSLASRTSGKHYGWKRGEIGKTAARSVVDIPCNGLGSRNRQARLSTLISAQGSSPAPRASGCSVTSRISGSVNGPSAPVSQVVGPRSRSGAYAPCSTDGPSPNSKKRSYLQVDSTLAAPTRSKRLRFSEGSEPDHPTNLKKRPLLQVDTPLSAPSRSKRPRFSEGTEWEQPSLMSRLQGIVRPVPDEFSSPRRLLKREGAFFEKAQPDSKRAKIVRTICDQSMPPALKHFDPSPKSSALSFPPLSTINRTAEALSSSPLQSAFRLFDLPLELVLKVMEQVEMTEPVAVFISSCPWLHDAMALPYLLREGIIDIGRYAVLLKFRGTCALVASFIGCLPIFDKLLRVEIGLDTMVACQRRLMPFFLTQGIYNLRIQFYPDSTYPLEPAAAMTTLHATLYRMRPGLNGLSMETVHSCTPPVQSFTSVLPTTTDIGPRRWDLRQANRSLRSLSVSAEWFNFLHFGSMWASLAAAPHLFTITVSDISSEEECNSTLSSIRSDDLQDVYLLTNMNSAINIDSTFFSRHRTIQHLSVFSHGTVSDRVTSCVPMILPAIPDIRFTCNSPHLSAVDASALSCLTAVPLSKFKSPNSTEYCRSFELLIGALKCLSNLSIEGLKLCLEMPWRLTAHLSAQVSDCGCAHAIQKFTIPGVKKLRFRSYDYSASDLTFLFQFQDVCVNIQELLCDAPSSTFEKSGGIAILSATRPRNSKLQSFSISDRSWAFESGRWVPKPSAKAMTRTSS